MSLLRKAEALISAAVNRRRDVGRPSLPATLADRIVDYEERLAMVLEGGDIAEAEAHRIATDECGIRSGQTFSQTCGADGHEGVP